MDHHLQDIRTLGGESFGTSRIYHSNLHDILSRNISGVRLRVSTHNKVLTHIQMTGDAEDPLGLTMYII